MKKKSDQKLGMQRQISRRDILHGFGALTAGAMLPASGWANSLNASQPINLGNNRYPPALTGLRGNHPGSFEVMHQVARYGQRDWGTVSQSDSQQYDIVIVGAGISVAFLRPTSTLRKNLMRVYCYWTITMILVAMPSAMSLMLMDAN